MDLVILQPFYLPYGGVFELVRLADMFVFYDDVQLMRRDWMVRNRIKTADGTQWLTVPVIGGRDTRVCDAQLNDDEPWARKHRRSVEMAYAGSPDGDRVLDLLDPHWSQRWANLAELNIATFLALCDAIGVDADFTRSSELGIEGRSSQRILDHCLTLGADRYISGPAARNYLDEPSFAAAGVELCYHEFHHPNYPQLHGPFEPGLSVVDLLANHFDQAGEILCGAGRAVPAATAHPPSAD